MMALIYSKAGTDTAISDYLAAHPVDAPVTSVNGETGAVVLDAADVGADPAGTAQGLVDALVIPDPDLSGYVQTTDPRLSDARTPTAHTHDDRYVRTVNGVGPDAGGNVAVAGGGGFDTEGVQDIVGAMIAGAGGSYDDAAGTITLPSGGGITSPYSRPPVYDDAPAVPAEGSDGTYLVTSAVTWPAGVVWSTEPDNGVPPTVTGMALVYLATIGGTTYGLCSATFPAGTIVFDDTTAPTAGTMTVSDITATGLTMTVTGASDETALHSQPYAFSVDGGTLYDAWQASPTYTASGLAPATTYQLAWKVRDTAGNEMAGATQQATTSAAPTLTVTYTGESPVVADVTTGSYTWTAAPIGAASPTRRATVTVHTYWDSGVTPTAVTIGGVSAVMEATRVTGKVGVSIWSAVVPSGTTADVVITLPSTVFRIYAAAHTIDGAATALFAAAASDGTGGAVGTVPVSAPSNGVLVAASGQQVGGATFTWGGGVTETYENPVAYAASSGATLAGTTAGTYTLTSTSTQATNQAVVAVSYEVA